MSDETTKTAATKAAAARPRTKNPVYGVFRQTETGDWRLITDPDKGIAAASRKDAIVRVGVDIGDEAYGTFATVKHGEFKVDTRGRKTEPQDVWS